MNQVELKKQSARYFLLKGRLVFDTVETLVQTNFVSSSDSHHRTKHKDSAESLDNKPSADKAVQAEQTVKEMRDVTLDCHQLSHMDSAGIALLLEWKRQLARQGYCLILKNLPQQAQAIIHATRLDYLLNASQGNPASQS
ncbi:MAG: STAS domain-containing protein [bacterium]